MISRRFFLLCVCFLLLAEPGHCFFRRFIRRVSHAARRAAAHARRIAAAARARARWLAEQARRRARWLAERARRAALAAARALQALKNKAFGFIRKIGEAFRSVTNINNHVNWVKRMIHTAYHRAIWLRNIVNHVIRVVNSIPSKARAVKNKVTELSRIPGNIGRQIAGLARRVFNYVKTLPRKVMKILQKVFVDLPKELIKKLFRAIQIEQFLRQGGKCRIITCIGGAVKAKMKSEGLTLPSPPLPGLVGSVCKVMDKVIGTKGVDMICNAIRALLGVPMKFPPAAPKPKQNPQCKIASPAYTSGPHYNKVRFLAGLAKGDADVRTDGNIYSAIRFFGSILHLLQEIVKQPVSKDLVMLGTNFISLIAEYIFDLLDEMFDQVLGAMDVSDGLIDGAEIQAAHLNSEELVKGMCQMKNMAKKILTGAKRHRMLEETSNATMTVIPLIESKIADVQMVFNEDKVASRAQFDTFDSQFGQLDKDISSLKGRLGGIDNKMDILSEKLGRMKNLMAAPSA